MDYFNRLTGKSGSLIPTSPELFQAHITIELSGESRTRISLTFVDLYQKGLSLPEIARRTGKARSTIRDALIRAGISMRPAMPTPIREAIRTIGKGNIRPYYGFCYFQGKITPDPREYENLLLIHRLWSMGTNPNRMAETLNAKNIAPRSAKKWNRNSIVNIVTRFESKTIVIKGADYELR